MKRREAPPKLTAPSVANVLPRQRLFAVLEEAGDGTVAFISAPAGSGKTTLAASYVAQKQVPFIWFRVDAADQDLATFFASLNQASRIVAPRKCGRLPTFTPEHALGLAAFSRRFFRELYQALGAPAIIVFDDLHEVAPDSPLLHAVLREACGEVAGGTHLILISREMVPPSLARLQANRALRLLDWSSLRLTVEEAQAIALRYDLPPARQQEIPRLIESVDGWAAGLIVALEGARADGVPSRSAIAAGRPVFDYFAAEVFEGLDAERQRILIRLSVLPDISAAAARELTGSDSAEQVLEELSRRNAFTQRIGEVRPVFRLHPLFRGFLMDLANRRLGEGEWAELRTKAALLLETEGRIDEAVVLWKGMEDWGSVIRILRQHAQALLEQGRLQTLERWLRCLPEEIVHGDGWLSLWLGTCIVFFSPVEARQHFERAYPLFTSHGDLVGRLLAWCGLADAIFLLYQDLTQLDPLIDEFDRELFDIVDSTPREIQARVTASVFTVLSFCRMGHPRMTLWADRARGLLANPQAGSPVSQVHAFLAQYHIWRGDLATAHDLVESLSQNRQDPFPSPQTVTLSYLVEATYALHAGLHDACIASANAGLEAARQSGVHLWDTIFLGHCVAVRLSSGDLRRADALLAQLATVLEQLPNGDEAYSRALTFWRHFVAKDIPKAMHVADIADRLTQRLGMPYFIAACYLARSLVWHRATRFDEATRFLDLAEDIAKDQQNPYLSWVCLLFGAYMSLDREDRDVGLRRLSQAMTTGAQYGYAHFFFWPRDEIAILCDRALAAGLEPEYVRRLVHLHHLAPPAHGRARAEWPWPIKIFTLGPFSIVIDGEVLRFEGKVQRGPLNLLKALIAFGGHQVSEGRIAATLWPEADGDSGEQSLATTLFRLRKLLRHDVIRRQEGRLTLDADVCWVDCQELDRVLNVNDPDVLDDDAMKRALTLYRAPFLSQEDDVSWALPLREKLHVKLVSRLLDCAGQAEETAQIEAALTLYQRGLEIDDLVEDFYRGLMRCYSERGEWSAAIKVYRRCQKVLSARMGVEPSSATKRLFLSVLESSQAEDAQ